MNARRETGPVLAAVDLADNDTLARVVDEAVSLATARGVPLVVMSVVPDIATGLDWRYAIRGETGGSEAFDAREVVRDALTHLQNMVGNLLPEGSTAETLVRYGKPYTEILDAAEELEAATIVIAAASPTVRDAMLGSTASNVARYARCSVTILRA